VSVPSSESDSECASPLEAKGGGEHHSLADGGGGGAIRPTGQKA
jgi:hypothetical protein